MSQQEKTPECSLGEHALCSGPRTIRRPGAPSWEAPVMTIRCACPCHCGRKP